MRKKDAWLYMVLLLGKFHYRDSRDESPYNFLTNKCEPHVQADQA